MSQIDIVPRAHRIPNVCRITGLGRSSIYGAISDGRLRAVKNGRSTLILNDDLAAFLHSLHALKPLSRTDHERVTP